MKTGIAKAGVRFWGTPRTRTLDFGGPTLNPTEVWLGVMKGIPMKIFPDSWGLPVESHRPCKVYLYLGFV